MIICTKCEKIVVGEPYYIHTTVNTIDKPICCNCVEVNKLKHNLFKVNPRDVISKTNRQQDYITERNTMIKYSQHFNSKGNAKIGFKTKEKADKEGERLRRNLFGRVRFRSYKCNICEEFHLTKTSKKD